MLVNITPQTNFGRLKKFKQRFKVCAYSNEPFEPHDGRTLEHIIPQEEIKKGKYDPALLKALKNLIVVKKSWNEKRSSIPLGDFIKKYPQVKENIINSVKCLEGKIIEGINWSKEVKVIFTQAIGYDIFK